MNLIALLLTASFAKFYVPGDLPNKPEHLENAIQATTYIQSYLTGDKCSGFFVSEQGHYVTALHCLGECLRRQDLFVNSDPKDQWEHPGPIDKSDFHKIFNTKALDPNTPIVCTDVNLTIPEGWEMYSQPTLLMVGRGWATVKSDGIDQLTEDQFKLLQNGIDDFAVLKFNVRRPMSCLKVSKKNQPQDLTWTLAFPTDTHREEGFNSDGRSRYSSEGQVRFSLEEDTFLKSLQMSPLDWERQLKLTSDPKYLLMTNDIVSQMSGGAVLDQDGEAVAIIYSSNAKDSIALPFWGTGFGMRLDYVQERTTEFLGTDVFTCRK